MLTAQAGLHLSLHPPPKKKQNTGYLATEHI